MSSQKYEVAYLSSEQIRRSYIEFFKSKGHRVFDSSSLVPKEDPTILFTNSGMNQFKAVFLGDNRENLTRVVDAQKCLRVSGKDNDLDEVGRDGRHHTFFEMMGNWSFGDYFKKEAITWAWELLTEVWKLPKDRLFATIYKDDDEAYKIWSEETDIDRSHIMRFTDDNFWEMGPTGPCGPSTEIVFDTGDVATQKELYQHPVHGVNGKDDRFLEIWNLVFIQQERMADGSLRRLSKNHVDTGAGLERLCAVIQKCTSNYQTDVFTTIIKEISRLSHVPYGEGEEGLAHRVIADHIRAITFAIVDGASPGNEGRGYVIRRILRRASRFAHSIGQKQPFLYKLVPTLVKQMGEQYPELKQRQDYVAQVIETEERRFLQTLDQGLNLLSKLTQQMSKEGKKTLSGVDVFTLYDTYGFPVDLTRIIAEEKGLSIDEAGYHAAMEEQKERGRQFAKFDNSLGNDESWVVFKDSRETEFLGYKQLSAEVHATRYREDKDTVYICLDRSPFYAEAGGQVGDLGSLSNEDLELEVLDTFKAFDMVIHRCTLKQGLLNEKSLKKKLHAQVDEKARFFTARHHSVTHLLHAALKQVLGQHVNQQGSYVGPDRLRFDFTFGRKVNDEELVQIENIVNEQIQKNVPIQTEVKTFDEAKKDGAVALFGEKYGEKVRVLTMGSFSKELCGGTHAHATGDIGVFKIVAESSVAAGVRRIEALAAAPAFEKLRKDSHLVSQLANNFKTPVNQVAQKVSELQVQIKNLEKELQEFKNREQSQNVEKLLMQKRTLGSTHAIISSLTTWMEADRFHNFANELQSRLDKDVAVLTHVSKGSLSILVLVGKSALASVKAPELMKTLSEISGGKGGGRPDRAQGGSAQVEKESLVLEKAEAYLKEKLSHI